MWIFLDTQPISDSFAGDYFIMPERNIGVAVLASSGED